MTPPTNPNHDLTNTDQIVATLTHNGGLARIESTLRQRLDEAGWSQAVKDTATRLFRTGEASSFDEAYAAILRMVNLEGAGAGDGKAMAMAMAGMTAGTALRIPREAKVCGAEAVKREVCAFGEGECGVRDGGGGGEEVGMGV